MATRTVRLDDEAEQTLDEVRRATGLPISEALKRGLHALRAEVSQLAARTPFETYRSIDLGSGGYASATSADVKRGVRRALKRKLDR